MKNKKILFAILISTIFNNSLGTNLISFFMLPLPTMPNEKKAMKKVRKLTRPGKLAKYTLKSVADSYLVSGIFCTYGGYLTISDLNGQVSFPRRHKDPKVNVIITKHIIPIIMLNNTIHHWELENGIPANSYIVERKQEEEIETFFWDIYSTNLPKDNIIPVKSIVIIADPKYVIVPTGITITKKSDQHILPDIYVKRNINKTANILYTLGINTFFQTTDPKYKKDKTYYRRQLRG